MVVSWSELISNAARNRDRAVNVDALTLISASSTDIDRFPINVSTSTSSVSTSVAKVLEPAFAPVAPAAPAAPTGPAAVSSCVPERAAHVPFLKEPISQKYALDPIVLGIENTEPLYSGAPHRTQRAIEVEEAKRMESMLDTLYKTCSGRSRGWTKVGLEGMIKPRCASGGDLKELDKAKKPFDWSGLLEDKVLSAFLDFLCLAKKIRCAVWFQEKKTIYLYPAADAISSGEYPLYHVDSEGHLRHGLRTQSDLLAFCDQNKGKHEHGWKLLPPTSVLHTLSGLKLDELESVGLKLGMAVVEGTKAERVSAIAAFKLRLRLGSSGLPSEEEDAVGVA